MTKHPKSPFLSLVSCVTMNPRRLVLTRISQVPRTFVKLACISMTVPLLVQFVKWSLNLIEKPSYTSLSSRQNWKYWAITTGGNMDWVNIQVLNRQSLALSTFLYERTMEKSYKLVIELLMDHLDGYLIGASPVLPALTTLTGTR